MPADWKSLARAARHRVSADDTILVRLGGGSNQTISVELTESGNALRLSSVIAGQKTIIAASNPDSPHRYAWARNRLSDLVGFGIDSRGRLIGEAWIPTAGLSPAELDMYLMELARVCDWHEFRLSGEDSY